MVIRKVVKVVLALAIILFLSCGQKSKEIRIYLSAKPRTLEPLKYQELAILQILCNIYEPLVEEDEFYNVKPVLAEFWEKIDSVTWVFYLRKNVKFHNGKPLTSKDVIYSIHYPRMLEYSEYRTYEVIIDTLWANSDTAVFIRTKTPYDFLINELSSIFIIPSGFKSSDLPCGTGPYKFKATNDEFIILERWNHYWGPKPYFKRAYIYFSPDPERRVKEFLSGNADLIDYLPLEYSDSITKYGKLLYTPESATREIEFNTNKYPLNNSEFRRAISFAIDREGIVASYYKGLASPANQFFPYGVNEHNPSLPELPFNPSYAKSIFSRYPLSKPLVLDYSEVIKPLGELIVRQLQSCGLNITGNPLPSEEFWKKIKSGRSDMFLLALTFTSKYQYSALMSSFHTRVPNSSYGASNRTGYINPTVDSLIENIMFLDDPVKRNTLVYHVQDILLKDMPFCPIVFERQFYGVKRDLNWTPRRNRRIFIKDMTRR
jgi:peptide/nickel transport system substrate-binding protein